MTKSQVNKIETTLRSSRAKTGLTAKVIAKRTKLTTEAVYRRIWDLRTLNGLRIYSNLRTTKVGQRVHYKLAA